VIAGQQEDAVGALVFQRVDVLVDRVRGPLVPPFAGAELRRDRVQTLAQGGGEDVPAELHVAVEGETLVLGEDVDPLQSRVGAVREREVDDAVLAGERHRRLGPLLGERIEPLPLAAGQDHRERALQ